MPEKSTANTTGNSTVRTLIFVWIAIICTSTSAIFVRYSTAPSLVLAAYRKTMVTIMLLVPLLLNPENRKELRGLSRSTLLWCLLSGFFLAIHFWTYFLSVHNTTIAASQVLVNTEVLFVALFMGARGKEHFNRLSLLGIAVALLGGVVVSYTKGGLAGAGMSGNLQAVLAAGMMASYSLIGRKVRANCSTTVYTFLVYGASALVLNLMVLFSGTPYFGYGKINYAMALGMAIFNSLLGHSVFNWSLKYLSPTVVSISKIFQPVFTVTWALILFHEFPVWNQLFGGLIVIAGIILYIRNKEN